MTLQPMAKVDGKQAMMTRAWAELPWPSSLTRKRLSCMQLIVKVERERVWGTELRLRASALACDGPGEKLVRNYLSLGPEA